ncbi:hypothetical protein CVT24_002707 [Panaeolus cyanescens]|uniref:BTB domain-containing protein n=1 Tax=Panaeolus cyanescens TaxID=181874 RepID=A0A409WQ15_9AGAR|nr:hypothetical protein CVT24_002707 [Panaeolus cyanescens]
MSNTSPVLAGPIGDCCVRGVQHTGTPAGKTITLAGVETYVAEPPASVSGTKKVVLFYADVFGPLHVNAHNEAEFDRMAWFEKSRTQAKNAIPKWFSAVKEIYGADAQYSAVGYCFGAPYVLEAIATEDVVAGAFAHPAGLTEDHFRNVKKPLLLSCAEVDHTFPIESRRRAEDILVEIKATYHIQVFSGVAHGFATRGNPDVENELVHAMGLVQDTRKAPLPPERFSNLLRSDFWFGDGNIVIIAGSAAFKVHRGQLERHSEIFSDLFAVPQPLDQDLIDGCPFVELQDSPSDVFYFLSALYDGLYFKHPRSIDFVAIAAVLRLSTKYVVEHLRQRCLARLNKDWPTTLMEWDAREQRCTDENSRYVPREHLAHPILVIELALDMNLSTILPAALYDLSRYGPSKIMAGTTYPTTRFDRMIADIYGLPKPVETPARLGREMLCRTLRGREATQRHMATFIAKELHCRSPSNACHNRVDRSAAPESDSASISSTTPSTSVDTASVSSTTTASAQVGANVPSTSTNRACHESFYFIMLNILRSVGGIACGRDADPLYTLVQATEMLSRTDFSDGQRQCGLKLCQACKTDFAASATKARQEVWTLLPQWFGLTEGDKEGSFLDLND